MTPLTSFSLRGEPPVRDEPVGSLLQEGRETGVRVHAVCLEAQFHVPPDLFLLFFTDDCPYEERLQILLLGPRFQVLDGLSLSWPYTPGLLGHLHPEGERRLRFEFFSERPLRVSVLPESVFHVFRRLPFFASPRRGRFFSRHHLTLEEVPAGGS